MIFQDRPTKFNPKFEVVGCFCEFQNKILLLLRQDSKPQGNTWGLPGGKKDKEDNSTSVAAVREVKEETGINVTNLIYLGKVYVKYSDLDFIYHMFKINFEVKPEVKLQEKEHKNFKWISPTDVLQMPDLIEDLDECIQLFYQ